MCARGVGGNGRGSGRLAICGGPGRWEVSWLEGRGGELGER